jgi:hypothetical protein
MHGPHGPHAPKVNETHHSLKLLLPGDAVNNIPGLSVVEDYGNQSFQVWYPNPAWTPDNVDKKVKKRFSTSFPFKKTRKATCFRNAMNWIWDHHDTHKVGGAQLRPEKDQINELFVYYEECVKEAKEAEEAEAKEAAAGAASADPVGGFAYIYVGAIRTSLLKRSQSL